MLKYEKKMAEWLSGHITIILLISITILSLFMRFSLRKFVSLDALGFLLPWFEEIKDKGGLLGGLNNQVGNYNLLYQFLIACMTYLPFNPLSCYKALSIVFDYLMSGMAALMYLKLFDSSNKWRAFGIYSSIILSPIVIFNSSAWAQCDSIYTFFVLASLFFLLQGKYKRAFILYGIAFAFKLQAIFLLPFFLLYYFIKKEFSILHFLFIPFMMLVSGIPCYILGERTPVEVFTIYFEQTELFPSLFMNYPSFWTLVGYLEEGVYQLIHPFSLIFGFAVIGLVFGYFIKNMRIPNNYNIIFSAFYLSFTTVLFLPNMHERYGFVYEILSIFLCFLEPCTLIPAAIILINTFCTYCTYLFKASTNIRLLAIFNIFAWLIYFMIFRKKAMKK